MATVISKAVLSSLIGLATLGFVASTARADIIEDPLHGFCNGTAPAGACVDNGTNTPLGSNSTQWGFSISPGPQTGDLVIDLLLPNNYAIPASFSLTGMHGGIANNLAISATATLFSATAWTTGDLATYLGVSASPANPIGGYLPTTQVLDPAATGFFVFQADIGTTTIWDNANGTNGPIFDLISGFSSDTGGYIVGFCGPTTVTAIYPVCGTGNQPNPPIVATANSGALLVGPPTKVPEPASLAMFGVGLIGAALMRRRRTR